MGYLAHNQTIGHGKLVILLFVELKVFANALHQTLVAVQVNRPPELRFIIGVGHLLVRRVKALSNQLTLRLAHLLLQSLEYT